MSPFSNRPTSSNSCIKPSKKKSASCAVRAKSNINHLASQYHNVHFPNASGGRRCALPKPPSSQVQVECLNFFSKVLNFFPWVSGGETLKFFFFFYPGFATFLSRAYPAAKTWPALPALRWCRAIAFLCGRLGLPIAWGYGHDRALQQKEVLRKKNLAIRMLGRAVRNITLSEPPGSENTSSIPFFSNSFSYGVFANIGSGAVPGRLPNHGFGEGSGEGSEPRVPGRFRDRFRGCWG